MRQAVIFVVLSLIVASEAGSFVSDQLIRSQQLQQQNEARDSEPIGDSAANEDDSAASAEMAQTIQQRHHQHAQALAQPVRLPRINIYASENEVKKLLGIDNRIDYVTNGQLNTYPLGFTIPMGYHLSDMIFTWQNLGPTNVNYSISLVIGNPVAVERPLINITRSGLIPRHEQVFKITLPCSGKLTDEVDVQVLINIQGLVPVESLQQASDPADQSTPISQADFQLARAVQNANNELPRANQTTSSTASPAQSSTSSNQIADQLQADEARAQQQQQQMRQVGHTIAIKRKKICTMHPVPVQPVTRSPETIRPPNQVPSTSTSSQESSSMPLNERNSMSKWPGPIQVEQQSTLRSTTTTATTTTTTTSTTTTTTTTTPEPPAHLHTWPSVSSTSVVAESASPQAPNQRARQLAGPIGENPLIELLRQQQQQQIASQALPQTTAGGNPLLLALIVMSLVLIAMLLLAAAASAHNNVAAMRHVGVGVGGARPIDKLNALTNCILRRSGAAGATRAHANKSLPNGSKNSSNAFNTLNLAGGFQDELSRTHANFVGGPFASKSAAGANTISGRLHQQQQQQQHSLYYYKQQQHNYLTTGPGYYQQQQQHHYQCPPDLLFGTPTTTTTTTTATTNEPYHINMNNTTKLYLGRTNLDNNGGNYTIDNNYTTTPIVPQTRSDSGSVYQTIY